MQIQKIDHRGIVRSGLDIAQDTGLGLAVGSVLLLLVGADLFLPFSLIGALLFTLGLLGKVILRLAEPRPWVSFHMDPQGGPFGYFSWPAGNGIPGGRSQPVFSKEMAYAAAASWSQERLIGQDNCRALLADIAAVSDEDLRPSEDEEARFRAEQYYLLQTVYLAGVLNAFYERALALATLVEESVSHEGFDVAAPVACLRGRHPLYLSQQGTPIEVAQVRSAEEATAIMAIWAEEYLIPGADIQRLAAKARQLISGHNARLAAAGY